MFSILRAFYKGFTDMRGLRCHKEKKMRHQMSDHHLDTMIDDSFPASDPPSTY